MRHGPGCFVGVHLPVIFILSGLVNLMVCDCAAGKVDPSVTGPSGSDMMCLGIPVLNLVLWLPGGIALAVWQATRKTTPPEPRERSSGATGTWMGVAVGAFLFLISWINFRRNGVPDPEGGLQGGNAFAVISAVSLVVNFVPGSFFYLVGRWFQMKRASRPGG